jgi:hypothetical protein
MMPIDSLTKSGKVTCAKVLTCITGMLSVEQSVFISNIFAMLCVAWEKCCQKFCKNIPHQQCCIKQQHTD